MIVHKRNFHCQEAPCKQNLDMKGGKAKLEKKNINDEIIDTWYLGQLPVTMHLSYTNLHASLGISAAADLGQEVRFLVYVSAHN